MLARGGKGGAPRIRHRTFRSWARTRRTCDSKRAIFARGSNLPQTHRESSTHTGTQHPQHNWCPKRKPQGRPLHAGGSAAVKRRARLRSVKPWALCNSVSKSTLELGQRKLLAHLNPAKNTSRSHALDIWARVLAGGRTSRAARRCSGWTGARSGRPSPPSRRPPRLRSTKFSPRSAGRPPPPELNQNSSCNPGTKNSSGVRHRAATRLRLSLFVPGSPLKTSGRRGRKQTPA